MNLKSKWGLIAGTVLVSGTVLAGASFAASSSSTNTAPAASQVSTHNFTDHLEEAVKSGKVSQGEADVLKQIGELRKAAMEKLTSESKTIVDQAVKDGKITQEQADKLTNHEGRFGGFGMRGHGGKGGPGWGRGGHEHRKLSQEELKVKLDAGVKEGKITQDQADQMLKRFAQHEAK